MLRGKWSKNQELRCIQASEGTFFLKNFEFSNRPTKHLLEFCVVLISQFCREDLRSADFKHSSRPVNVNCLWTAADNLKKLSSTLTHQMNPQTAGTPSSAPWLLDSGMCQWTRTSLVVLQTGLAFPQQLFLAALSVSELLVLLSSL